MAHITWLPLTVALLAASIAAVTDIWKYRVYNVLTIPLLISGLAYHGLAAGGQGIGPSLLGALFGFGVLIVPHLLGLMGAGDVKLMAGVGAWLGLQGTVVAFVVSALVAGLVAVAMIIVRGKFRESWLTLKLIVQRFAAMGVHVGKDDLAETLSTGADRRVRVIPFGAMVPVGVLGTILWLRWQ
ncbi:MAG: A24 family peptidase [Planctomycetia bacterium]|nr:A24 family peptidase [Planctomycetia bacterium]